jgi:acyl carrier protein
MGTDEQLPPRSNPCLVTREQVFTLIQSHLADELDVEPGLISDETRFKEDLQADSLDLYTLVQELEDTCGVSVSDEQAARILTVGQTVDFVLAHATAAEMADD